MAKESLAERLRRLSSADPTERTWALRPEILLHPNIPKPLHEVAPRNILGASWWNKTRREAYRSTDYHCVACGVHKSVAKYRNWLEGHEVYRIDYLMGRAEYIETVPLCHFCHNYIHDGRLRWLLDTGKLHHGKYTQIIQHGDEVLRRFNLVHPEPYSGPFAEWADWRLVLFDKEYPPKYKTFEEWAAFNA